jgi:hypothetical protein
MSAAMCPRCSAAQGKRVYCCQSAAVAEVEALRRQIADLTNEVRCLKDENDILEELRSEAIQMLEAEGVYFP